MDTETLVIKLRKISDNIINDHKSVNLIMLFGNSSKEQTTAFDYVISAIWLNNLDQDKGMDIILDYLFEGLSIEELKFISRVTIIHTNDPSVQIINRTMGVRGGTASVINCVFDNIEIPFAIIFESSR